MNSIITSIRIIYKVLRIPFGFLMIIMALLNFGGFIPGATSGEIETSIIAGFFGIYIIYSSLKKKNN